MSYVNHVSIKKYNTKMGKGMEIDNFTVESVKMLVLLIKTCYFIRCMFNLIEIENIENI